MKTEIHIGNLIKEKLKERDLTASWLARQVHCDCSNFNKMLRKSHLDTELLMRISCILNFDFFIVYHNIFQEDIKNKQNNGAIIH